ncbi:MAG: hypothetical protein IH991_04940 [Planctomycetes bacterium]|nr:hypothetical protein [Planctomycetota bacterium]
MAIPRLASVLTLIFACIVLTHLNVAKLAAQEEKNATSNDQPESPKADAPDPKEPTQPTKDSVDKPKTDPEPGKSAAEFATLLTEWKDIIKSLRNIQVEFQKAENEEEAEKLRKTFDNLVAKGDKLIPQIRAVGIAVYVKAPNEDRELTRLLCTILNDEVSRDMNESAFKLAEVLIANECERPGIHMLAGIAAFATNNFAKAEEYLKKAKEENETFAEVSAHTPQKIEEYLTSSVELQDLWTKELEIRKKEAEADDLPRDLLHAGVAVSGIYDFEPILYCSENDGLRLDADEARTVSPIYREPATDAPQLIAYGMKEPPEMQRQSNDFVAKFQDQSTRMESLPVPGADHFDTVSVLGDETSVLFSRALEFITV